MTECIPVEEMGTLSGLPADDARRRHVASCPRCSSLVFVYDQFVKAEAVESAKPEEAEEHLERIIAERIASPAAVASATRPRRWFDLAPFRVAVATAAVVVVALAVWQPWRTEPIVYRGEVSEQVANLRALAQSDGSTLLSWDAVSGADSYRVVLLGEDLGEIARLEPGSELSARMEPRAAGEATPSYWQVVALADGGELLTSGPQRLP